MDEIAPPQVSLLLPQVRTKVYLYLGVLVTLMSLGDPNGGLIDLSISFLLKNKLHLSAHELASFRLATALPLYLSGVFGLMRDRWAPGGLGDRKFFILFGAIGAGLYLLFSSLPLTTPMLMAALVSLTSVFLFLSGAFQGFASTLGQQHAMSGRVAALWQAFITLPWMLAFLVGGHLSDILESQSADHAGRVLFLVGAIVLAAICVYGFWRPRAVFDHVVIPTPTAPLISDLARLVRHKPIYPALAIWLFWNFAPGAQTPLQYYVQNELHAPDSVWGEFNALVSACFIPPFVLFGFLCRRFPLRKLLFWGTIIAVPQLVPLLFVKSIAGVLTAGAFIGLVGGIATAAYVDLLIRSCPQGLQGTTLMLAGGLYHVASRFGDLLGTVLYDYFGGFTVCVALITLVYLLILPLIALVPQHVIATADGQPPPTQDLAEATQVVCNADAGAN